MAPTLRPRGNGSRNPHAVCQRPAKGTSVSLLGPMTQHYGLRALAARMKAAAAATNTPPPSPADSSSATYSSKDSTANPVGSDVVSLNAGVAPAAEEQHHEALMAQMGMEMMGECGHAATGATVGTTRNTYVHASGDPKGSGPDRIGIHPSTAESVDANNADTANTGDSNSSVHNANNVPNHTTTLITVRLDPGDAPLPQDNGVGYGWYTVVPTAFALPFAEAIKNLVQGEYMRQVQESWNWVYMAREWERAARHLAAQQQKTLQLLLTPVLGEAAASEAASQAFAFEPWGGEQLMKGITRLGYAVPCRNNWDCADSWFALTTLLLSNTDVQGEVALSASSAMETVWGKPLNNPF